jgi:tripartite-type tricarboxylate transporter receptor subunit TctC
MTRVAVLLTAVVALVAQARADDYPSKPIHVLTTSSAGGISDIFMRVLGEELHKSLNQPLIIDNRPGGAGNIAARACQDAQPDGYTICIINADPMIYNQFLFKNLSFRSRQARADHQSLRSDPGAGDQFRSQGQNGRRIDRGVEAEAGHTLLSHGLRCRWSPTWTASKTKKAPTGCACRSRAAVKATNAILGGSTPIGLIGLGNVISNIRAGKMTALALINNIRTPLLPDVPTLEDLGYKGAPSQTWYGLFAPPGTPRPIIDKIAAEVKRVFADKDFVEKYVISRGQVPAINTPDQFAAQIKADRAAAQEVVKASGMQPQ